MENSLPVKSLVVGGDDSTKTSAPVRIDASLHQDQHLKQNQTFMNRGIGPVVENFPSGKVHFVG